MCGRVLVWLSVVALASLPSAGFAQEDPVKFDEATLKSQKIGSDGPALVAYLKDRSLTDVERDQLKTVIEKLGARSFTEREKAEQALVKHGPAVRALLKDALKATDPEVRRRAERALEAIEAMHSPAVTAAVLRLLALRKSAGAIDALLLFAPYTEGDQNDEELFLAAVAVTDFAKLPEDGALIKALQSPLPTRRGLAGYVLGRSPDAQQRKRAQALLKDKDLSVRFRIATGLLAGHDKAAVPELIALLREAPEPLCWQVEEYLVRLAAEPQSKVGNPLASENSRKEWAAAWERWWKEKENKIDLAKALEQAPYYHLTLLPEMHANQISEIDRNNKVIFKLTLNQPRCVHSLPGGRFLVGEANGNLVSERDRKGTILWKHPFNDPSFCERLANGNTVMGNGHSIIEVTPDGKEVMNYKPGGDFYIHGMCRKSNGNLVLISMKGVLRELTPAGKEVFSVTLQGFGKTGNNWCHVQALPRDRYLVTDIEKGLVVEVDKEGKAHWEYALADACCAQRLPNGNTVIQSFNQKKLIELDRTKTIVWEYTTSSAGWRFHRR